MALVTQPQNKLQYFIKKPSQCELRRLFPYKWHGMTF